MGTEMEEEQGCSVVPASPVPIDLYVDGRTIGVIGLKAVFEQFYRSGRQPDAVCADELAKIVAAKNEVPADAASGLGAALLREYAKFHAEKLRARAAR